MLIKPAGSIVGRIQLPGDKSISHRAAILASMAEGTTKIANFSTSVDCAATVRCLEQLGVDVHRDGNVLTVKGVGKKGFRASDSDLDCENSGTTVRLLSGVLAGQTFTSVLTGDESLRKRPMKRVIDPLVRMGAVVESKDGSAPLTITGTNPLKAINYELPVASAQIKSCVLLAGLNADGETSVTEAVATRDHTERMLRSFECDVREKREGAATILSVSGSEALTARDIEIPGDISAAAFFLVAAACLLSSEIELTGVGLNPTRTAIIDVLRSFSVEIRMESLIETAGEPLGNITVISMKGEKPNGNNVLRGEIIPNLIDEIPILAVLGTQLENGLEIRDAGELRVKETDRISAVVENLKRMGASVEEFADGFRVERSDLQGASVNSFGDHRIAMAFAVAGLLASGTTEIIGSECVDVSFPDFFNVLGSVVR